MPGYTVFISEIIYYQNKINNNKVYLSAVLSKNKYYRSKHFWRSIMELKLAHKLGEHIERLKKLILPEEKKKGLFSKIGSAMGITNTLHKNSLLSKSRILPLIKDYNEIEESKVDIIDKMMIQEMQYIIKDNIYANVSSYTIIKQLPDDEATILKEAILQLKISQNVINFLAQEYKDLKILIIHMTIFIMMIMLNIQII